MLEAVLCFDGDGRKGSWDSGADAIYVYIALHCNKSVAPLDFTVVTAEIPVPLQMPGCRGSRTQIFLLRKGQPLGSTLDQG